jgi:exodeoxyribonuclease VII large subunit
LRRSVHQLAAGRLRRFQTVRLQLETWDLRRRIERIRARMADADGRLAAGTIRRFHRRQRELAALAGQLDALSPLAVLGRGYAVCWTGDRSRIVRNASMVAPGEPVTVTLDRGELDCRVETVLIDEGRLRGTATGSGSAE